MVDKKRGQPNSKSKSAKKIAGLKKEIAQLKAIKGRLDKAGVKIKPLGKKPGDTINASGTKSDNAFLRTYKDRLAKLQRRLASLTGGSIGRTEAKDMRPSPANKDIDDAGPKGQEARRDKSNDKKPNTKGKSDKEENKRTSMKDFKKKTKSDGGPQPDKVKKKKKKSMMGTNRIGAGKGRYGDDSRGNYLGQR